MDRSSRWNFVGGMAAVGIAASLCGCVTKAESDARVRAAYQAGYKDGTASAVAVQHAHGNVFIIGPVQKSEVPWVAGLTLTQALATANYTGHNNPTEITLYRSGVSVSIDPNDLLNGHVVSLVAGDTIILRE